MLWLKAVNDSFSCSPEFSHPATRIGTLWHLNKQKVIECLTLFSRITDVIFETRKFSTCAFYLDLEYVLPELIYEPHICTTNMRLTRYDSFRIYWIKSEKNIFRIGYCQMRMFTQE